MSSDSYQFDRVNDYNLVTINLASAQDIRGWSFGEVKKPETINYRTYRPEKDGLFCERIFGPEKDWECACGKYRGMKYKGMICDRCGVKVTHSRVRRKRMGHIELAAPVVHIWFFKSMPSRIGAIVGIKTSSLEKVIYFQDYMVVDVGDCPLRVGQLLSEEEHRERSRKYGRGSYTAEMGADAVRRLLTGLDLVALAANCRREFANTGSQQKKKELIKRLKIIEALRDSKNKPEYLVLECVPVIPPDLRPLVLLESGNFATSDLNDLYRRIINRNNRLKKLVDLNAPEVIVRNEKRMLQQSVDALFDNNRCKRPVLGSSNRPLKSLTDMIKGKQGRFRENLLGKRVDYSARSVIVVGPELKLHQCGLPKRIALELYQPFIIRRLKEIGHADTIKSAKRMLERRDDEVWDILDDVIQDHPVLLNRAPTLHRIGIQAFEPTLVEGNAIRVHPLVCKGFNADFDGDQMAVHLPLSLEAQVEAHTLMLATHNIFSPANGSPIISPSQDIVMGCYYATIVKPTKGELPAFANVLSIQGAVERNRIGLHQQIRLRIGGERRVVPAEAEMKGDLVKTGAGRALFNSLLPGELPYYDVTMRSRDLSRVISDCYRILGRRRTIVVLDELKSFGFKYSTLSGLSFGAGDLTVAPDKDVVMREADGAVSRAQRLFEKGIITNQERYNQVLDAWTHAREQITKSMMAALESDVRDGVYVNPIYLMAHSGARGGVEQIRQLAGMRGLMAKPNGEIIEAPIKANFKEGLNVLEYFSSTHGARKGLADTALKTADSGYLTRKLADVCQNVVVTCRDCGTIKGLTRGVIYRGEKVEVALSDSVRGRVSRSSVVDPVTDEVIVRDGEMITNDMALRIEEIGVEKIQVRSPLTCEATLGVCQCCYGMDLSTGRLVEEGLAVGIVAAQSIGEPGTQLTMRTFHIGGTARREVEENELRSRISGVVQFARMRKVTNSEGAEVVLTRSAEVLVCDERGRHLEQYQIPMGATLLVREGEKVEKGARLCQWDPHALPIVAEVGGRVRFEDCIEGASLRTEAEATGNIRRTITEFRGDLHPQVILEDSLGKILDFYYLPERANLEVTEGAIVAPGTILARTPRESGGTQDITGGLPRVTELFEARKPRNPAVIAEIDGVVEFIPEKRRGKRVIAVRGSNGETCEVVVPPGVPLLVHAGDTVRAGDALVRGPLVPHDILRIGGAEAVQDYLLHEIQGVYRSQRVEIDDKHIEIVVSQMLRRVRVTEAGDTGLLPGASIDRTEFRRVNRAVRKSLKVINPGDTEFLEGELVSEEVYQSLSVGGEVGHGLVVGRAKPAKAHTQLLGITKAAVQSESFISAASFQETTKVLTEAALASKVDCLSGLKENVILGHLIPAGTGFRIYRQADVRIRVEALAALEAERSRAVEARMNLLAEPCDGTLLFGSYEAPTA